MRRILRDLLAACMCAPTYFSEGMRPTRSARTQNVRDPRDNRAPLLPITIRHSEQWWSARPPEFQDRTLDYMHPSRVARRMFLPSAPVGAARESGASSASVVDTDWERRTHANRMVERWARHRATVLPQNRVLRSLPPPHWCGTPSPALGSSTRSSVSPRSRCAFSTGWTRSLRSPGRLCNHGSSSTCDFGLSKAVFTIMSCQQAAEPITAGGPGAVRAAYSRVRSSRLRISGAKGDEDKS